MTFKLKPKVLIIALAILAVIGWAFVIYFITQSKTTPAICSERLEKIHSYALLLDKSVKLARQDKSLDELEMDVRLLDNGSLLNTWQEVVFGGNQEEDLNYYLDVIIDSLKFFSK